MRLFGYYFEHKVATDPAEPRWSNTIKGNRHERIFSLEKVTSHDGIPAYSLSIGKHQLNWARLATKACNQPG